MTGGGRNEIVERGSGVLPSRLPSGRDFVPKVPYHSYHPRCHSPLIGLLNQRLIFLFILYIRKRGQVWTETSPVFCPSWTVKPRTWSGICLCNRNAKIRSREHYPSPWTRVDDNRYTLSEAGGPDPRCGRPDTGTEGAQVDLHRSPVDAKMYGLSGTHINYRFGKSKKNTQTLQPHPNPHLICRPSSFNKKCQSSPAFDKTKRFVGVRDKTNSFLPKFSF